ncbi:MAG: energy transducer TonB [Deltaproteobacteria bacterium]
MGANRTTPVLMAITVLLGCVSAPSTRPISPAARAWLDQVKEKFRLAWEAGVVRAANKYDPTGCLHRQKDRRTALTYTVAADGRLSGATLTTSSGVPWLDQVALDVAASVGAVAPPPPELLAGETELDVPFRFIRNAMERGCEPPVRGPPPW